MPLQTWLHDFFTYEARNGGAPPPRQLFPFLAHSNTPTEEPPEENGGASNAPATPTSSAKGSLSGRDASSSLSSPASSSPPPPPGPPPTAAIAPARRTVNVRDVGCHTAATPGDSRDILPRFYSRFVFLHTVTALQLLWGYFSLALWNYLAHIRWYGASMVYLANVVDDEAQSAPTSLPTALSDGNGFVEVELHHAAHQWVAVAYLAFSLAGLTYTVCAVLYVCVVNTPGHVRAAWPHSHLWMSACCPTTGTAPHPHHDGTDGDDDPFYTYGPVKRGARQSAGTAAATTHTSPKGEGNVRSEGDLAFEPSSPWSFERAPHGAPVLHERAPHGAPVLHERRPSPFPLPPAAATSAVSLSFTQPQFLFPLRGLGLLDDLAASATGGGGGHGEHPRELQHRSSLVAPLLPVPLDQQYVREGRTCAEAAGPSFFPYAPYDAPYTPALPRPRRAAPHHRGNPKLPLLWCTFPLVLVLVIFDFIVIHSCRVQGWPVRLLQGLTPALGLLLLLYTISTAVVLCVRCCVACCAALPITVYTPARPPMLPRSTTPDVRYGQR